MRIHVLKFGGSSLRDATRLLHVASIIKTYVKEKNIRPIVVLSAMGKTTSALIQCAQQALPGGYVDLDSIEKLHMNTIEELGLCGEIINEIKTLFEECRNVLKGVSLVKELSPATQDVIMSFGERLSVRIFACLLRKQNFNAKSWDAFDIGMQVQGTAQGSCQKERIGADLVAGAYDIMTSLLLPEVSQGIIPVVTGFIAKNEDNKITTLGRGGSDLSASLIGSAVLAQAVEIWTDTDGILTGDPRIVQRPTSIPQLTFEQAGELAQFGAKVLHPRTIQPAMEVGVPVVVRNSYNIEHPGTIISAKPAFADSENLIVALSLKSPVILVDIKATHMMGQFGFLAEVFSVFQRYGLSVDVIATSEVSISMTLDKDTELSRVESAKNALKAHAEGNRSIVALIGNKLKASEILEVACGTLKRHSVLVEMVSLGASKLNTSLVIATQDETLAMKVLHEAFFSSEK